ncbi:MULTISPECIES: hypothetical protein [Streptomyces]|jgi:hypothetical protein|uniref:Uncharacterized protein n=1 Tax=Streptomyces sp. 900129855 TaxID=3155129 RepID=A0ABV2ZTG0_9ACTN
MDARPGRRIAELHPLAVGVILTMSRPVGGDDVPTVFGPEEGTKPSDLR